MKETKTLIIDPQLLRVATFDKAPEFRVAMERRNAGKDGRWIYPILGVALALALIGLCVPTVMEVMGKTLASVLIIFTIACKREIEEKEQNFDRDWTVLYGGRRQKCIDLKLDPGWDMDLMLETVRHNLGEIADKVVELQDHPSEENSALLRHYFGHAPDEETCRVFMQKGVASRKEREDEHREIFKMMFDRAQALFSWHFMKGQVAADLYDHFFQEARVRRLSHLPRSVPA